VRVAVMRFVGQRIPKPLRDRHVLALRLDCVEEARRRGDVEAIAALEADHDLA
jgi:hypothetical protein